MNKTIMVVDDSASLRQVVGMTLRGAGYEVLEATDGQNALAHLQGQRIHLVVCDVNMPNLDGIGFLRAFKELPSYKFTPVIMLTTETEEEKKQEARAAGARAWVVKPFKADALLGAIRKLVLP